MIEKLEPVAEDAALGSPLLHDGMKVIFELSIAVSLRRIADALERLAPPTDDKQ